MSGPQKTAIAPSFTWGSSARIEVTNENAPGPAPQFARVVTAQLAQVSLPEPAVCSVYFQAAMTSALAGDTIEALTLNLLEGVGRVTVPRQITYLAQPAVNAPLEVTIPWIPVHALNVDIALNVRLGNPAGSLIVCEAFLVLSPLTRIQQKEQEISFGMSLPGEADDMDDELRAELEAEGPTVEDMMHQLHGSPAPNEPEPEPDDDDDDDDDDGQVQRVPAWLLEVVERLTHRLGRKPTKLELASVVRRIKQRRARRRPA